MVAKRMCLLVLLCLLGCCCHGLRIPRLSLFSGGAPPATSGYSYETRTYQQQLDHYNYQNKQTFDHRYLVNTDTWVPGGPIFFYTGNEGDITWFCNNTGFMWDIAPYFNAMLVFSEHRYYGTSLPFGDKSFTEENVVYLSVEQALADHATLIDHIKLTTPGANTSTVIAFGGSYGGMLAAWIRMKYPNLVAGSIAASAPIWQFGDLTPCEQTYKVLTESFEMGGEYCPVSIRMSWDALDKIDDDLWLHDTFKVCGNVQDTIAADLSSWLQSIWFNMAMANYPYHASFLEPLPAWPVKEACKYLNDVFPSSKELLTAIAAASSIYYNYTGQAKCLDLSQTAVSSLGQTAWNFQACTEMVLPTCSNGIDDMYPPIEWNIEEYTKSCRSYTGFKNVTPKPNWAITQFGGKDITSYTKIFFSNGQLDPWSAGGVLETLTSDLPAVVIPNAAHHLDLRKANPADVPGVVQARLSEMKFIKGLL